MKRVALCGYWMLLLIGCGKSHAAQQEQDGARAIQRDTANAAAIDSAVITPAEITLGDSVFNGQPRGGMCATCHGPRGVGTAAAPRLDDQDWIHGDGSLGFIEGMVVQGVPHPTQHALAQWRRGGRLASMLRGLLG